MAGAWRGGLQVANVLDVGTNAGASQGVTIAGPASTFTKGSWVQLVASATRDSAWIMVYVQTAMGSSGVQAIDVGVGASGSEQPVISNLLCSSTGSIGIRFLFPVAIQAGTRIAARLASGSTNDQMIIGVTTLADTFGSVGIGSMVDTYGVISTTNLGSLVDPGTSANTKGAYTQLTASLTSDISGFLLLFDCQAATGSVGAVSWLIDLAVGPAGSEHIILPNLFMTATTGSTFSTINGQLVPYVPYQLAAATRVAVRAQCSTATSPDRHLGATLYGVRQ